MLIRTECFRGFCLSVAMQTHMFPISQTSHALNKQRDGHVFGPYRVILKKKKKKTQVHNFPVSHDLTSLASEFSSPSH